MLNLFLASCLVLGLHRNCIVLSYGLRFTERKDIKSDFLPPAFTSHGPRLVMFKYNDPFVMLHCHARGNPRVRYSWKKGNQPLDLDHLDHFQQVKGSLNISTPSVRDEGYYQCFAANAYGTAVSDFMQLKMAYQNLPPRFDEPRIHRPLVRSALTLRCRTPNSFPRPDIYWIRPEAGSSGTRIEANERLFQDDRGRLHFANVRSEDTGNYSCVAINPYLRSFVQGEDQIIEVLEDHPQTQMRPQPSRLLWSSPIEDVALIGQTHSLKCFFSGFPTPVVTWMHFIGRFESSSRVKQFGHEFQIVNVTSDDEGQYQCSISTGESVLNRVLSLTVEANPRWASESMVDLVVDEESPAKVICDVTGLPRPDIKWFINGRQLRDLPRTRSRLVGYNYINYVNTSQAENQVIQCNASNKHGYLFKNAFIKVLAQAPKFKLPLPPINKISSGSTLALTCDVIGSPRAEIGWYKTPMDLKSHDYSRYAIVRSIEDWVCNQIEYDDDDEKENKLVVANGNEKASVDTFYRISQDNNNNKAYYMHINNSGSYVIGGLHSLQGSQTTHDDSDVERSNCGNCSRHCPDGCSSCSGFKNCSNNNCSVADGRGDDSKVKLYIISNDLPPYPNAALNILDFVDFEFNVGHFLPTPAARKLVVKDVGFRDSAFYHCHARNKFGTNTTSTLVIVTENTKITTKPSDKLANARESVELTCRAKTDERERANLVIRWYRLDPNDSTFVTTPRLSAIDFAYRPIKRFLLEAKTDRVSFADDSLVLRNVKVADTGWYLCHATNGIDFDEAVARLTVRDRPSAPKKAIVDICSDSSASLSWEHANENNSPIIKYIVYCYHETKFDRKRHPPLAQPITTDDQNDSPSIILGPTQYFYRCAVISDQTSLKAERVSAKLSLTSFAVHQFRVAAVNILGEGPRIQTSQSCETLSSRPFRNPIGVCTDLRNCSQLVIVWQPLQKSELNAEGFYYLISYQLIKTTFKSANEYNQLNLTHLDQSSFDQEADNQSLAGASSTYYGNQSLPSDVAEGVEITQVKKGWNSSEAVIEMPDCKFRRFFVYVQSVNELGFAHSEDVDMKIGYSGEGKPSVRPRNLRINHEKLVGNSVELFWDPVETDPMSIKGIFKGYQIHAWMTEDPTINRIQDVVLCRDVSSLACSSSAQLKQDLLRSDFSETRVIRDQAPVKFILLDLWPNTMVTLGILVVSQTHKGDLSDTIEFMTLDAPPTTTRRPVKVHSSGIDDNGGTDFYDLHEITTGDSQGFIPKDQKTSPPPKAESANGTADYFDNYTFIYEENGDNKDLTTSAPPKREEYRRIPIGSPKLAKWFIGMSSAIGLLLALFIIVCIVKRRKGRRYLVHEREKTKGRELDWPHVRDSKENVEGRRRFAIGRLIKKKSRVSQSIDSETSSLKEYEENGDMTTFLEDGSFIGQYCSKPILELPKAEEPMNASILATYI